MQTVINIGAASSVGNRVDYPLQKVGSSSPVVACKNTMALLKGGVDAMRVVKGWSLGSGSHIDTVVALLDW